MVEYVKGSEPDRWHWCKNCTQYLCISAKDVLTDRILTSVTSAKQKKTTKTAQPKDLLRARKLSFTSRCAV